MKVLFAESHNLDRPDPLGSHHYIRLFQRAGHDCLWLGPAVSPMHIFKPDQLNRHRFQVLREGSRNVEGIKWLVPFTLIFYYNLPLLKGIFTGRNQYRFALPPLRKTLKKSNFMSVDLLWCAGPIAYSLLDLVPHRVSCYRIADRLDQFSRIPKSSVELQKELIRRVDLVVATSRSLFEWVREIRRHEVYYVPNGVSELFIQPKQPLPSDFPETILPVAVYLGTIDSRFDIETITAAVMENKDVFFLLIGPLTESKLGPQIEKLQRAENFSWLGPKRQDEAVPYLQNSNIGLIPFYLNDLTEAVNPIKYYEYLACGLPVLASPLRELQEMKGPLFTYKDQGSFNAALKQARSIQAADRQKFTDFAAENTWLARFGAISSVINEKLASYSKIKRETSEIWLSVIIVGRNEAKNLPDLFKSLPAGRDIEWLYIDSGSTDGSPAIAAEKGAKVYCLDNNSVYAPGTGRYVGTREARGQWLLYLDGDMALNDQFKSFLQQLKEQEDKVPSNTAGFVGHTTNRYLDVKGTIVGVREYVVFAKDMAVSAVSWGRPVNYHGGAVLYRRDAVIAAGNWNPALLQLEEIDLLSRIKAGGREVRAVDLPMADHFTLLLSLKEKLLLNFLPVWRGKKLYGAGQVVAARLREGGLAGFIAVYPYPFIVLTGLAAIPLLYLIWPPLPLIVNLGLAIWIGLKKQWYYYLVYLGNLLQIIYGIGHYSPFKPGYRIYDPIDES